MIVKTLTGVSFFDEAYGGFYRGRCALASGRSGTGKTLLGLQFILQGLRQDERCLILSAIPAADLTICAEALNLSISPAIDSGNLVLLEYHNFIPGRDREHDLMLPPEGFEQIREIIDANAVQRVVLDTVLPWVAIPQIEQIAERVFSFVRAFDRLGTTTLLTLPKPVSPMAFKLKNALEEVVPISITLTPDTAARGRFAWHVSKYLGENKLGPAQPYGIVSGQGLGIPPPIEVIPPAPVRTETAPPPPESRRPAEPAATSRPIRFASAFPSARSPAPPARAATMEPASRDLPPPPEPGEPATQEKVRFSSVWPRPGGAGKQG